MNLYAVFCATTLGGCVVLIDEDEEEAAKGKAIEYLEGEDISDVKIQKVEKIEPETGPCIFWDNELAELTEVA